MIRNYFKIAWRNLKKNRLQTVINLLGLTVGTMSCFVILLYVLKQTGYDQHHENSGDIYRVETDIIRDGQISFNTAAGAAPIATAMKEEFPEVENFARVVVNDFFNIEMIRASDSKEGYYEPRVYTADASFFDIFKYDFIEGSPSKALVDPNTTVLSSKIAQKLFANQSALGKTVVWGTGENAQTLIVKGVFNENTFKSHLNPNYVVSIKTPGMGEFVDTYQNFATNNFIYSYVKLVEGTDVSSLQGKLSSFIAQKGKKDFENAGMQKKILTLESLENIHLNSSGRDNQVDKVSSMDFLYFLMLLAFFIQLVACINFINLSTARASKRNKEIGIRKVVGAGKRSLIYQFLGESMVLSFLAIFVSIPLVLMLLPFVNELTDSALTIADVLDWKIGVFLLGLGIITGLLSGLYPAIILSSVKPLRALKANSKLKSSNSVLRRGLVVFQFALSISLIVVVIVITQQLQFTQNKDLGYAKDNLIAIRAGTSEVSTNYNNLKTAFLNIPGVVNTSMGMYSPSDNVITDNGMYAPGGDPMQLTIIKRNGVSKDYINTMQINLTQGRDFTTTDQEDQIIVNKAALKAFNIPEEEALSSKLLQTFDGQTYERNIIGVVEDYHFSSLKDEIAPLFLYPETEPNWVFVKVSTANYDQMLSNLESSWKNIVDSVPFSYSFVDEEVANLYKEERRLNKISVTFTALAIIISCLGLFGLVSFMAEQKKKEIGIRKVLGATVNNVVQLLTKDFMVLIVIAFLIASPLAYYAMDKWLQNYTYHIDISWWIFAIAGLGAIVITLATVSFQAIKAAVANPVNSLRTE